MPAKRSKKRRTTILAILSTIAMIAALALITLLFGRVRGVEFSPTHFTSRSFVFYEIPIVHLQVWPIKRTPEPMPSLNLLRSKNYIKVPSGDSEIWHLVEIKRGPTSPTPGDAEILVGHMRLGEGTTGSVWENWSRDNPAAAAVLWPAVKRLAERELYLLIPDLFSLAEKHNDANKLAAAIDGNLRQEYLRLAEDLVAAKQPLLAENLLDDALIDFPDDPALRELAGQLRQSTSPGT